MFPEKSPAPDGRGEIFLPLLSVYYLSLLCVVTFSCTKYFGSHLFVCKAIKSMERKLLDLN